MTSIEHKLLLIIAICNYLICRHEVLVQAACDANAINIDDWIRRGHVLDGAVFWNGKLGDITKCAVACIRRKVCRSLNYNLVTNVCELNVAVEGERPLRNGTNGLLYSEIEPWLSQFDPSCAGRPCTANEVCLPGQLAQSQPGGGECSYFCMESSMLCPKPYDGFSGNRKVGTVHNVTCERGEVGGDSAECLVTLQWSKVINTECAPVYQHACNSDTICQPIDGVCTDSKCQCPDGYTYDTGNMVCIFACDDTLDDYNNVQSFSGTGANRTFTCDVKYVPVPLVSEITCEVDTNTQTGTWTPATEICADMYGSDCPPDADCSDIEGVCDQANQCNCASNKYYDTTQKLCISKFRLDPGNGGDGVTSGHLKINENGVWGHVCEDEWTWQATNVVCRDLDPSYVYGGVYHHIEAFGPGSGGVTWKYKNLNCPTSATSFTLCNHDPVEDCSDDKAIGITCYQTDITDHIRLNTTYQNNGDEYRLEVLYNGEWGTVCEQGWGGSESEMACKTMFPSTPKKDQECKDSCAGGPPGPYQVSGVDCDGSESHFFYCRNNGWAMPSYSCPDKQVGLSCKAN